MQGAFREHIAHLSKLPGVSAVEVRQKEQLAELDGLIIPGGEFLPTSTCPTAMLYPGSPSEAVPAVVCGQGRARPWP